MTMSKTFSSTRLILVRHGPTEWSKIGRYTGRTDISLTSDASLVASRISPELLLLLGNRSPEYVDLRASPLKRALEMARLTLPGFNIRIDPLLIEWDYGDYEGLTIEQIRVRAGDDWDLTRNTPPNGESVQDLLQRCEHIAGSISEQITICFSHGHLLKALISYLLTKGPGLIESFYLAAGGYCVLDNIDSMWRVTMLENGVKGSVPVFV